MLIGTHQQLSKVRTYSLLVAGTVVSSVSEARNLGVWFDSKFQFQTHINKTYQSAFYYIYKDISANFYHLKLLRPQFKHQSLAALISYCNSVLYGIPAIHTNKLQRVQNAAGRLLTNKPRYSHITPVMVDLHWLPVRFRIIFKVILFTFKAVHGTAPTYITNLLSFKQSRYNL